MSQFKITKTKERALEVDNLTTGNIERSLFQGIAIPAYFENKIPTITYREHHDVVITEVKSIGSREVLKIKGQAKPASATNGHVFKFEGEYNQKTGKCKVHKIIKKKKEILIKEPALA